MSIFTPLKLAGLACMGVGGTCSVVYAGSSLLSDFSTLESDDDSVIQNINDKFGARLISGNSGKSSRIWFERLKKLRGDKDKVLDGELKLIRDSEGKKETDLKTWCEESKIKPQSGEESKLIVEGVEAYCTYTIEDQISRAMPRTKTNEKDWELVNKKLSESKKESLSKDLQSVYDEVKGKAGTSGKLRDWCFEKYGEPFKGRDDVIFKEVSRVCMIVNPSRSVDAGVPKGPDVAASPQQAKSN